MCAYVTNARAQWNGASVWDEVKSNIEKLLVILNGDITINANMQFLIKNNHSDLLVLKTIKVFIIILIFWRLLL